MAKINYLTEREVLAKDRQTILGVSLAAGLPHIHACGGQARCSTCRILVVDGLNNCSDRTELETKVAERLQWPDEIRLACQTRVLGDICIRRLALDTVDQDNASEDMRAGNTGTIGREQHIVALFTDVRNYTPFVEQNLPYDVLHVLRRIFAEMSARVREFGGVVNNYMGDGMVALFGVEQNENSKGSAELDAVCAAAAMLKDIANHREYFVGLYKRDIEIGIGIDAGTAVLGELGTGDGAMFTAIGPPMNKAARIESATKICATNLAVSDTVYEKVRDRVRKGETHEIELKGVPGISEVIEIEEVFSSV